MRKGLLLTYSIIIFFFSFGAVVYLKGVNGSLSNRALAQYIYSPIERTVSPITNLKFEFRGPKKPKSPIVIAAIDEASIEYLGRWPWPRAYVVELIERIYAMGAKVVAADIIFSEAQQTIPESLQEELRKRGLEKLTKSYDDDALLAELFLRRSQNLVSVWQSEGHCVPNQLDENTCPIQHPEVLESFPKEIEKFAFTDIGRFDLFKPNKSLIPSVYTLTSNLSALNNNLEYAGFTNAFIDGDGVIRKSAQVLMMGGKAYPSFALQIARAYQNESIHLNFNHQNGVDNLFLKDESLNVNQAGFAEINYRGKSRSFPLISAYRIFGGEETRGIASESTNLLKGAIVLLGVTALAVGDVVATPFDPITPGVEVQANIVDNLISQDFLVSHSVLGDGYIFAFLLSVICMGYVWLLHKLPAKKSLVASGLGILAAVAIDFFLFKKNINLHLEFAYIQLALLSVVSFSEKYVTEEHNKRFLKDAFSQYVAPSVVTHVIKNPSELHLGGKKEIVTILFSDLRGFSTLSEKMSAKEVSEFLNYYLDLMTEVVFEQGGTLDKYIGDAVMAFWGAPLKQKDHAARACRAALEMTKKLERYQIDMKYKFGINLKMGVSAHTGEVSVGNMGSSKTFDYTVIGDNVNLASRLESSTKELGIQTVTSIATLDAIKESGAKLPIHRKLGSIHVKGREKPIEVAELVESLVAVEHEERFQKAIMLFKEAEFLKAKEHFKILIENRVEISAAKCYLSKCEFYLKERSPENWDGSIL